MLTLNLSDVSPLPVHIRSEDGHFVVLALKKIPKRLPLVVCLFSFPLGAGFSKARRNSI